MQLVVWVLIMATTITGNKILSHLDRVVNNQAPITADIFLNNFCNSNCPYCTYKRWDFSDDARSMPFERFVEYAERMRQLGVLGFILSGGGEPTISKDFDRITEWLDKNGYAYGINSNLNRYISCKPRYLKVALDGWDEDSYEKRRGIRGYQTVRNNIFRFAIEKSPETKIGIQLVAQTAEEVYKFYAANKDLPVDYMVIRPVESTNGCYYRDLPDEKSIRPADIIRAINEVKGYDNRIVMNYKWLMLGKRFDYCVGQWTQIAVNELGEVMYCCHKPFQTIGHIMDDDILEKKRAALTDMKLCDVPCRLTGVNHELQIITGSTEHPEFI